MKWTKSFAVSAVFAVGLWLLAAATAHAFCGFYVGGANQQLYSNATMVVMMRSGNKTVLSMQNDYEGPPENFAMVVPVPEVITEENVRTLPRELFAKIDQLAAPRLVEYWEQDPCHRPQRRQRLGGLRAVPSAAPMAVAESSADSLGVTIEAQFAVAEYDIVILSARDSSGLETWLQQENYNIPNGARRVLRPYVQAGTKFFVAKVDVQRLDFSEGKAKLSPLRVHYNSQDFSLPVRLGLLNSQGTQDLIVHVLAEQRYEAANKPNVSIPTNIRVRPGVRRAFGGFYNALFDRTVQQNPGSVVTEYSWDSSSCDPCPGPTLDGNDLMTLGADVAPGGARGRVLTRLHYRYDEQSLGDDLVFQAAPPLIGGRGTPNAQGQLDRQVLVSRMNMFQGRYAILHRWKNPTSCRNPVRGRWGGPPNGRAPGTTAATNLAYLPRNIRLENLVRESVPEIRIRPRWR